MSLYSLLITCTITLLASLAAGYLPLSLQISARSMRSITTTGVGLLVGTAFIVIIPEGIHTIYNIDAAHAEHDDDHQHNVIDVTTDGSSQKKSSHSSHQHTGGEDDDDDDDDEHDTHNHSDAGKQADKSKAKKLADNIQANLLSMQALRSLLSPASEDNTAAVAAADNNSQRQLLDDHKAADAVKAVTDKTIKALSTDSHTELVSIDPSAGSWIGPSLALGFVFMLLVDRLSGGHSHVHAPDDDDVEHQAVNDRNGMHAGADDGDIELQPLNQSNGAPNTAVNGASSFASPRVSVHSPSRRNTEAEVNVTDPNHSTLRVTPTQSSHSPPTPPGFNLSRAASVNSNAANSTLTTSQQEFNKSGMIGILTHSAVDGLALGAISVSNNKQLEMVVFLAIVLHKAPAAFGLSSFLIYQGRAKRDVMQKILIFSLMAPMAALLTFVAFKGFDSVTAASTTQQTTVSNPQMLGVCLLFSAGTFLFTIAVHILPEITGHQSHAGSNKRSASANDSDGWWYTMCLVAGIMMPCLFTASHAHAH